MDLTISIWSLLPPLPVSPGAPFQLNMELSVPKGDWSDASLPPLSLALPPECARTCAVGTVSWMAPVAISSSLFPVLPLALLQLQIQVIALSLVLPPAPSALAADGSPWIVHGPGCSLPISEAINEPVAPTSAHGGQTLPPVMARPALGLPL